MNQVALPFSTPKYNSRGRDVSLQVKKGIYCSCPSSSVICNSLVSNRQLMHAQEYVAGRREMAHVFASITGQESLLARFSLDCVETTALCSKARVVLDHLHCSVETGDRNRVSICITFLLRPRALRLCSSCEGDTDGSYCVTNTQCISKASAGHTRTSRVRTQHRGLFGEHQLGDGFK